MGAAEAGQPATAPSQNQRAPPVQSRPQARAAATRSAGRLHAERPHTGRSAAAMSPGRAVRVPSGPHAMSSHPRARSARTSHLELLLQRAAACGVHARPPPTCGRPGRKPKQGRPEAHLRHMQYRWSRARHTCRSGRVARPMAHLTACAASQLSQRPAWSYPSPARRTHGISRTCISAWASTRALQRSSAR